MIVAPYEEERPYDIYFEQILLTADKTMHEKNDDYQIMCFGRRGSGKSSLMLWAKELYEPDDKSVDNIGFDQNSFTNGLKLIKDKEGKKFLANDEANISKRLHASKWNTELIDLYYAIRGLKIFHWWNNPSLEMIDKPFIEDIIKGFIYIPGKGKNVRVYYFFRKNDLLSLYDKIGNLKISKLNNYCNDFAYYKGWFRKYDGDLWKAYDEKKQARMKDKVEEFWKKFGGEEKFTQAQVAGTIGISPQSVMRYTASLIREGLLQEGKDITINPAGMKYFTAEAIEIVRDYALEKHSKPLISV